MSFTTLVVNSFTYSWSTSNYLACITHCLLNLSMLFTWTSFSIFSDIIAANFVFTLFAASTLNAVIRILSGRTFSISIKCLTRHKIVVVFPDPAQAFIYMCYSFFSRMIAFYSSFGSMEKIFLAFLIFSAELADFRLVVIFYCFICFLLFQSNTLNK